MGEKNKAAQTQIWDDIRVPFYSPACITSEAFVQTPRFQSHLLFPPLLGTNQLWSTFFTAGLFLFLWDIAFFPLVHYPSQSQLKTANPSSRPFVLKIPWKSVTWHTSLKTYAFIKDHKEVENSKRIFPFKVHFANQISVTDLHSAA